MKHFEKNRISERGSAGVKALCVFIFLALTAHAGINYIPVAYNGANFKQEMETAVVKGLAAPARVKPVDLVQTSIQRAAEENGLPEDAVIEVKGQGNAIVAHAAYTQQVNILPFGLYKYKYNFDHTATPHGYLTKE
jgi:hypothetical protein